MKETEYRGRVPRLRFPDFRETGEWATKSLKYVCELNPTSLGLPKEFVYIDLESVEAGKLKVRKMIDRDNAPSRAQRLLENRDVIFQVVRPYQRNNLHFINNDNVHYVASTGYTQLRARESDSYLFQIIHTDDFVERVIAKCTGSNYPAINSSDLAEISLAIPGLAEQQKIADCLSSLDELITLEAQKLNALKTHKKGLMQQLFPAEGETVPRLRFPEFWGAGEWDKKQLEEFAVIVRGGSPRPIEAFLTIDTKGFNWLKIGDIDKESKFVTATQEKVIPAALSKTRMVNPGDLILSNSMSFGRPYILKIETCIHDGWIAISEIHADIYRDYLYYLLMTSDSQEYFSNNAAGSGVQNLNADIIKRLPIPYPGIKEQQKIADCLSSLDELITAQAKKIESLKTHKTGLMQQLFPVLEETVA